MRWGHDLGDLSNVAYSLRLRTVPLRNLGASMSPETAFEVMSGLETLSLRMDRHCENARKAAIEYSEIFPDRFFLEVQDHNISEEKATHPIIKKLSSELNLPMVATNDCHYARCEHWEAASRAGA